INSSVGLEALVAGKPVVAFGVDYPPQIVPRVKEVDELLDAAYNRQPKMDAVKKFVAELWANSVFLHDPNYFRTAELAADEDAKELIRLIVECYDKVKKGK
ncbi:MAG: hypothetical protein N3E51_05305, partial [Candidatus Micrarchaeota archaeon]|nr:hypothetical protein [Candidatus Micrarchaeota archaeon]